MFKLQFPEKDIKYWADRYIKKKKPKEREEEKRIIKEISPRIRKKKFLEKEDFKAICIWKTARPHRYYEQNSPEFIKSVTKTAFTTDDEKLRIGVLTLLKGVGWPVASAMLHFMFPHEYPILDFRTLESLGKDVPKSWIFNFWKSYIVFCRKLTDRNGVTMRDFDRALWQYSKEGKPKRSSLPTAAG